MALLALACVGAPQAQAQGKVRIAQQFGLSYLPLHVALELKLIEKHAKAAGEGDVGIEVVRLASGAAVNDAIISGTIDVAMAGLTVLLNLRDKTVGPNMVKGMMAIADSPIYFNTTDPRIQSVKDFQETDRIAMTAGKVTQHAVILQMAAAAAFGWDNRAKLDSLAVGISHPDGVVGLLSGGGNFKTHATTVPFIQMELADARVRTLFSSYDVIGRRHTLIVAYSAERWRREAGGAQALPGHIRRPVRSDGHHPQGHARGSRAVHAPGAFQVGSRDHPWRHRRREDALLHAGPYRRHGLFRPHGPRRLAEEQAGKLEGCVLRQRPRPSRRLIGVSAQRPANRSRRR